MTIYENIKDMSIEEMTDFLKNIRLSCEYGCDAQDVWSQKHWEPCCEHCEKAITEWLGNEVEE